MTCSKSANGAVVSASIQLLYNAVAHRLIPWAEKWDQQRIVVTPHSVADISQFDLPSGVQAAGRKLHGQGKTLRVLRLYDYTMPTEHWPVDGVEVTPFPLMICVLNGSAQLEIGDYVLQCEEGTIVMVPPNVPHADGINPHLCDWQSGKGSCDLFWMYYWKGGIICHLCHSRGSLHIGPETHEECFIPSPQALLCFDVMTEEMAKPAAGDMRVYRGGLLTFLSILRGEFEEGNYVQHGIAMVDTVPSQEQDPILRVVNYIQFHLNESLTIDSMAYKSYMSRTKFVRRFRDKMGLSFVSYVNEQRVRKVKSLLRDTDWTLETICELSGLKQANLRILVRRYTGMSPIEYRRKARNKTADEMENAETTSSNPSA